MNYSMRQLAIADVFFGLRAYENPPMEALGKVMTLGISYDEFGAALVAVLGSEQKFWDAMNGRVNQTGA